ncbi:hypothetical protein AB0O33_09440, partial [Streptomyces sp. NPDC089795]
MQLRGRRRNTAAAVAVIGTLLGGAVSSAPPGIFAAPTAPDRPAPGANPGATPVSAAAGPMLDPGADIARAAAEGPAVWP